MAGSGDSYDLGRTVAEHEEAIRGIRNDLGNISRSIGDLGRQIQALGKKDWMPALAAGGLVLTFLLAIAGAFRSGDLQQLSEMRRQQNRLREQLDQERKATETQQRRDRERAEDRYDSLAQQLADYRVEMAYRSGVADTQRETLAERVTHLDTVLQREMDLKIEQRMKPLEALVDLRADTNMRAIEKLERRTGLNGHGESVR